MSCAFTAIGLKVTCPVGLPTKKAATGLHDILDQDEFVCVNPCPVLKARLMDDRISKQCLLRY